VVDEHLRTSDPHVFAAGDVARYPDPVTGELVRVEHFVHAERQGQAAARNLLGRVEPYRDPPFFWSAHYDQTLSYVGHASSWDRVDIRGSLESFDFAASFSKSGRILAVVSAGRDRVSLIAEALLASGDQAGLAKVLG
jgi:NADPH-dependent 2,4-dienoyl-CoA reductase/sulfur reductase-like enzyme